MARTVAIGLQDFEEIIQKNCFYVDKTAFIKEWWESEDHVTLIVRPRRFGKTLNMSMLEQFFSTKYAGRGNLFEGLSIWEDEKYRKLQGTYPVISFSFANVKERNYPDARSRICQLIAELYTQNSFLKKCEWMTEEERDFFDSVRLDMPEVVATLAIRRLCGFLYRHYGEKPIVLLDEYDTPMQEAYVSGFWEEIVSFMRSLFNATFKTNPYLARAVMTGITRVSIASYEALESIFSDLNNLEVVTTTSDKYAASFGFTEEEVFAALEECGLSGEKELVKQWYDGFIFGNHSDIYNPWSILNFLDKRKIGAYWANTSSNSLVGNLLREGHRQVKEQFEALLRGDVKSMNIYMNRVALNTFSYFDTGTRGSGAEPERFYHGFVLGLIVELQGRYHITSNRESGFGRYDVVLEPKNPGADDAMVLEFKVHDSADEETLADTVAAALNQIEEKQYVAGLMSRGILAEQIRSYGFAFEGKNVLIGDRNSNCSTLSMIS